MTDKNVLLTFAGSLRHKSYNKALAKLAQQHAEALGKRAVFIDLADYPLPLFNEDTEYDSQSKELAALRELFDSADALFIASPEYNGSFSAALKNTIDWLSRPSNDDSYVPKFDQYTVAVAAASPGGLGGIRGLSHLRELMSNLGSLVLPQQLAIGAAYEAFDENGALNSPVMEERFASLVESLVKTATKQARQES